MRYLYLLLILVGSHALIAQNADSLNLVPVKPPVADTTEVKPKRTFNPIIMKASIDSLVEKNRTENPFMNINKQLFLYHSGYHITAMAAQDIYLQDHGFTVRQSPFGLAYELQKRMAFSNCISEGRSISFEEKLYPYPASLASTEFGIGGQDMNYAHLSIRKNDLVGVDSLYGRFNALFQRGIWGRQNDNSTLEDLFLKFPVKGGNLQFHANALDWDIPRFQHEFAYSDNPDAIRIREKSTLLSLYWQNKWLNAGFQMNHVNWMAPSFSFNGVHDFNQILLDKEIRYKPLTLQLRYEHFFGPDIVTVRNQFITQPDLNDLGTLNIKYVTKKLELKTKVYGANPKAFGYDNEWLYRVFGSSALVLNASGFKSFSDEQNFLIPYERILQYHKTTIGFQVSKQSNQLYQVDFGFLSKQVSSDNGIDELSIKTDDQSPYIDLIAQIPLSFNRLKTMIDYKLEAPFFQSVLDISMFYDLPYDNRVLLGLTHTYRDKSTWNMGMYSKSLFNDGYEARDNLLDAYAGLQITKQFDIRFTVKNFTDQVIVFNTPLMPVTYLLSIKWDFVN